MKMTKIPREAISWHERLLQCMVCVVSEISLEVLFVIFGVSTALFPRSWCMSGIFMWLKSCKGIVAPMFMWFTLIHQHQPQLYFHLVCTTHSAQDCWLTNFSLEPDIHAYMCPMPAAFIHHPMYTSFYSAQFMVLRIAALLKLLLWTHYTSVECWLPSHSRCQMLYSVLARVNACGGTHVLTHTNRCNHDIHTCTGHTTLMSGPIHGEACVWYSVSLYSLIVIVKQTIFIMI